VSERVSGFFAIALVIGYYSIKADNDGDGDNDGYDEIKIK
jgi:hypothetical protein